MSSWSCKKADAVLVVFWCWIFPWFKKAHPLICHYEIESSLQKLIANINASASLKVNINKILYSTNIEFRYHLTTLEAKILAMFTELARVISGILHYGSHAIANEPGRRATQVCKTFFNEKFTNYKRFIDYLELWLWRIFFFNCATTRRK